MFVCMCVTLLLLNENRYIAKTIRFLNQLIMLYQYDLLKCKKLFSKKNKVFRTKLIAILSKPYFQVRLLNFSYFFYMTKKNIGNYCIGHCGVVVVCLLCMQEALGSNPCLVHFFFFFFLCSCQVRLGQVRLGQLNLT